MATSSPSGLGPDSPSWWQRVSLHAAHLRRLWRDFTGESAYDRYLERHRREHPDHEPLTAREFWRQRARFDEDNVKTGCC